jgi:hypothetical protein
MQGSNAVSDVVEATAMQSWHNTFQLNLLFGVSPVLMHMHGIFLPNSFIQFIHFWQQ